MYVINGKLHNLYKIHYSLHNITSVYTAANINSEDRVRSGWDVNNTEESHAQLSYEKILWYAMCIYKIDY